MIEQSEKYLNWQKTGMTRSSTKQLWTNEYNMFTWEETYMIDEVPLADVWDNFATTSKLELENLYRLKSLPKECTKHYMCFRPELSVGLSKVLAQFENKLYNYNFLKLTPGYNLLWHYDSYSTFVKFNNINQADANNINRTIIMITPWSPGQILQVGNDIASHWNVGDTFTWNSDTWHGLSNFGFNDCVVMQVTWLPA